MKKWLAMFLTVVLLLTACTCFAENAQGTDGNCLNVYSTTAVSGNFWSRMFGTNTSDMDVQKLLHAYSPVIWSSEAGVFVTDPTVASAIVATDNSQTGDRTYTVVLQQDLCYSDGSPINAYDYAFSWLLAYSPVMREIGAMTHSHDAVVGASAYLSGETDVLAGVNVVNDFTFTVTVSAEYVPFFYELGLLDMYPYPVSVIAPGCKVAEMTADDGAALGVAIVNESGEGDALFTAALLQKTVLNAETGYLTHPAVCSGPYILTSYDGTTAVFAVNPQYKGNRAGNRPSIETLTFTAADNAELLAMIESGNVGLINKATQIDVIDAGLAAAGKGIIADNYTRSGMSMLVFCCECSAVAEADVRQAIAYCLDRETLVQEYVGGYGMRVDGYYGVGQWMVQLMNGTAAYPVAEGENEADELSEWESMSLSELQTYMFDVTRASALLTYAGWTQNSDGGDYTGAAGEVRAKTVDGELVPLQLKLAYPEGNAIGDWLNGSFRESLAEVGVELACTALPQNDLFACYYGTAQRDYDMLYLATNFSVLFDPSAEFALPESGLYAYNHSKIADDELYRLAADMRSTVQGDALSYCRKWLDFQKQFAQLLPMIPVYSNVYFDFHAAELQNYAAESYTSWAESIVDAYIGDVADTAETAEP